MVRTQVTGPQILDGSVSLTADVAGVLPILNGGTGQTTLAAAGILVSGGALGTPSSGTATNLTGFPTLNQSTTGNAATATALATARTINGVSFNGTANITVVPRVGTTTSTATPTIDCALYDQYNITALAVNITGFTFSNTFDGCKLLVRITGTAARTITWGSGAVSSGTATLLATTATTKTHMVGLIYDSVKAAFVCQAVDAIGY